jgi:two-component system, sporulation sensor kinase E
MRRHADEREEMVRARTRALQASEAHFRAIFEEAGIGIILSNRSGRVLDSNRALQQMLGYSDEEIRGRAFTDLFCSPGDNGSEDGHEHADIAKLFGELLAGKRDVHWSERYCVRKDGTPIWVEITVSPIRKDDARARHVVIMVEDVTERKQAQEALIQAEKLSLTGKLAASLAHEINNPLQTVLGCLDLAEESLARGEDKNARELLEIGMEELERAASIVGQLRDLNRPSDPAERESTDVNTLVERVLTLTERRCQKRQVEVEWETADGLAPLMLAPDRIQQVFLNLVLNAIEAMPDGGHLEVRTRATQEPAGVCISFADSGCGIAADALSQLFDPFYTTKADGLGLGLYVSNNIVEEHGGRIEVESKIEKGTTFDVWLPAS